MTERKHKRWYLWPRTVPEYKNTLSPASLKEKWGGLYPGVMICCIVAVAAHLLAEHYSTPAMLWALLLGMTVSFLGDEGRASRGINFTARRLLRIGVLLLGIRVSASLIVGLGFEFIVLTMIAVALTIIFGLIMARLLGERLRMGLLTAGSVAICGASAAIAFSALFPDDERGEERLIFTVVGVTVLSTTAMITYPVLVRLMGFNDMVSGVFIGGAIHDVAQVVGAGFTVSDEAGETATLVKLFRVAMLAPVVLVSSIALSRYSPVDVSQSHTPVLPRFVIGFIVLATANSLGLIPASVADWITQASGWLLLIAISAVGMKTNLKQVLSVGAPAITLIVSETVFIACLMLIGIKLLD